jgi:hypothetical protein
MRPILGPLRCTCDEPLTPFRVVDGGIWGSLACRRCARLMAGNKQPTTSATIVRILGCVDEQEGIYEIENGAGRVVTIRWDEERNAYQEVPHE